MIRIISYESATKTFLILATKRVALLDLFIFPFLTKSVDLQLGQLTAIQTVIQSTSLINILGINYFYISIYS